jgi:hypothetical protein
MLAQTGRDPRVRYQDNMLAQTAWDPELGTRTACLHRQQGIQI